MSELTAAEQRLCHERMRRTVRVCIERGLIGSSDRRTGVASELARHFGVSRQWMSQIVQSELWRMGKRTDGIRLGEGEDE